MNIYELAKALDIITIDDIERYTVIELIYMICNKLNETTVTLKQLIEVGLQQAVAEQLLKWIEDGSLEEELSQLVLKIPYQDYDRNQTDVGYGKSNKAYEGFSSFQKKTYGRYEQGTVVSIMANADNPKPEILGTDTKGLASYTNRDSCALYVANSGQQPPLTIPANQVIYHANDCVIPSSINMSQFEIGMILDTVGDVNDNWYVGIIKEINGTTLTLEDGWYQVRNDGHTPTKGVPGNNLALNVNTNNKIWNVNSNMFIHEGCPAGTNMELGVLCDTANINDVGGIDLINMGSHATHYGVKVRGKQTGFNEAFISDDNLRHYVAFTQNDKLHTTPLLRSMAKDGSEQFAIMANGLMKGQTVDWQILSSSGDVLNGKSVVMVNGSGVNVGLPSGNGGRIITFMVIGDGTTLLTAPSRMGIKSFTTQQQQVDISKGNNTHRVITIFSDGGTWYFLSDSGVE